MAYSTANWTRKAFSTIFVSAAVGSVLVYTDGAWIDSVAMDGTTAAKDAYIFDNLTLSSNVEINNLDVAPGGNLLILKLPELM